MASPTTSSANTADFRAEQPAPLRRHIDNVCANRNDNIYIYIYIHTYNLYNNRNNLVIVIVIVIVIIISIMCVRVCVLLHECML